MRRIFAGDRWVEVPQAAFDKIGEAYSLVAEARGCLLAACDEIPGGLDGTLAGGAVNGVYNLLGDALDEIGDMSDAFWKWCWHDVLQGCEPRPPRARRLDDGPRDPDLDMMYERASESLLAARLKAPRLNAQS